MGYNMGYKIYMYNMVSYNPAGTCQGYRWVIAH